MRIGCKIWLLILLSTPILGQQKEQQTLPIIYQSDRYLDLVTSPFHLINPDLSSLSLSNSDDQNWNQRITHHEQLYHQLFLKMDSIQQLQTWQNTVYQLQIEQLQTQIDELQLLLLNSPGMRPSSSMAVLDNQILVDYNVPKEIPIYFEKLSSSLDLSALMALNEIIELLAYQPEATVLLSGLADDHIPPSQNILLSQKRVEEVRNMLLSAGISPNRIISRYAGDGLNNPKMNSKKVIITFIRTP